MAMSADGGAVLVASKDWAADVSPATGGAGGLVVFARDADSGLLGPVMGVGAVAAPSYVAYNRARATCYVTSDFSNRAPGTEGYGRSGRVSAFRAGPAGQLEFVNDQASEGLVPCHLAVHQDGRHVISVDYGEGIVTVHPLLADGSLSPASDVVRHEGRGPNIDQQTGPHAHMVRPVPGTDWLLVTDLGTDEVIAYTLGTGDGRLRRSSLPTARVRPGAGPRHLEVHPSGRVFVLSELESIITVFEFDAATAAMKEMAEVPTVPEGGSEGNAPSGLVLSPDNRYLYVGNRGRDTIAVFRVEDRGLARASEVPAGGEPRDLSFAGEHLYVASQRSGVVSVFGRDPLSGSLGHPLQVIDVPSPSCVLGL